MQEWKKAMAGPGRGRWFELLQRSGHLISVCPPVASYLEPALTNLRVRLDRIIPQDHDSIILALWLLEADQATTVAWMDSMPLSSAWKRSTLWLLTHGRHPHEFRRLSLAERRRCWRHPDGKHLARFFSLQNVMETADLTAECAQEPNEPLKPLARAEDLMRWGVRPGPDLGKLLRHIEDGQLAGQLNDTDDARAVVQRWLQAKAKET